MLVHVIYIRRLQNAFVRKFRCTFMVEPLNHIHQDTKSARLIAVCKRTFNLGDTVKGELYPRIKFVLYETTLKITE